LEYQQLLEAVAQIHAEKSDEECIYQEATDFEEKKCNKIEPLVLGRIVPKNNRWVPENKM